MRKVSRYETSRLNLSDKERKRRKQQDIGVSSERRPGSGIERHAGMGSPNAIQKVNDELELYPVENRPSQRKQLSYGKYYSDLRKRDLTADL